MVALRAVLGALLLLMLLGRFLPGPLAWGFNHLAYLPLWMTPVWAVAALIVAWPGFQRRLADWISGPVPRWLFGPRWTPIALALVSGGLFALLRERSFFMGDGYLVAELVDRGMQFRAFDALDYLLHNHIYRWIRRGGTEISAFTVYRVASVVAGVLATATWLYLLRRLPWEGWRKTALFALLVFSGPAALFFGYIESYSFLFLFLTAFLLTGMAVLEGRGGLWLASAWFGLGVSFHLTAVFSGPALLFLALRAPIRPAGRRWLEAAGPAAAVFAIAVALHLAAGYNAYWFRQEFVESKNAQSIFIPLDRFFSAYTWKDLANLVLITAPVAFAVAFARWRTATSRAGDPRVLFLLIQIGSLAIFHLFLDRKLGGARDWDLLAAHSAGVALLAALLLPSAAAGNRREGDDGAAADSRVLGAPSSAPGRRGRGRAPVPATDRAGGGAGADPRFRAHPVVAMVLGTALLWTAPWVLLLHLEERSIARFVDVASDFPAFARAYAYEEVGKYYRKAEDYPRALQMYERCVEAYPGNARFRILLGSIYFTMGEMDMAEEEYREGARLDPNNAKLFGMSAEMLGKIAIQRGDPGEALEWFRKMAESVPTSPEAWQLIAYAAVQTDRAGEAERALRRALQLDPNRPLGHDLGVALMRLERYEEAAAAFQEAIARGQTEPPTRLGLGLALLEAGRVRAADGRAVPPEWMQVAEGQMRLILSQDPGDAEAQALLAEIRALRGSMP